MDALVTAFVASALAEWGDRTQLLAAALAAQTGRPARVLAALFLAIAVSSIFAALAGVIVAGMVSARAMTLMVALALLFAGIAGLIRRRFPDLEESRLPFFLAAAILFLAAETGDRSQFLTFALAGRFDSPLLATAGAVGGIMAAAIPAALLGERLEQVVPIRILRLAGAALFLLAGFLVAIQSLQLV